MSVIDAGIAPFQKNDQARHEAEHAENEADGGPIVVPDVHRRGERERTEDQV